MVRKVRSRLLGALFLALLPSSLILYFNSVKSNEKADVEYEISGIEKLDIRHLEARIRETKEAIQQSKDKLPIKPVLVIVLSHQEVTAGLNISFFDSVHASQYINGFRWVRNDIQDIDVKYITPAEEKLEAEFKITDIPNTQSYIDTMTSGELQRDKTLAEFIKDEDIRRVLGIQLLTDIPLDIKEIEVSITYRGLTVSNAKLLTLH